MDSLPQNSDELYHVDYTGIEEILRNKRSNNLPGDNNVHKQEAGNHASRLSTVSTVYQVLKDRNKEESHVVDVKDNNPGTPKLAEEIEIQTMYGNLDNAQDNGTDRHEHKYHTKKGVASI